MPRLPADSDPSHADARGERLQKVLASAGFGSRRACEELITTGRVSIDGQTVTELGTRVDLDQQKVAVDGERLKLQRKVYYAVHKPRGSLCTTADPAGRPRVVDLVPPTNARLFTVGRLDENTEGLILVTNDGELAHRLAHPRFQVERVYRAMVAGQPDGTAMEELRRGFFFTEGKFRVRELRVIKEKGKNTLMEVVMTEGQNREVRRLFARIGHKVLMLKRIAFGPLKLGDLELGAHRLLRGPELHALQDFVTGKANRRPSKKRQRPKPDDAPRRPIAADVSKKPTPAGRQTPTGAAAPGRPRTGRPASRPPKKKTRRPLP